MFRCGKAIFIPRLNKGVCAAGRFIHSTMSLQNASAKSKSAPVKKGKSSGGASKTSKATSVHALKLAPILLPKELPKIQYPELNEKNEGCFGGEMVLVNSDVNKLEMASRWVRRDLHYFDQLAMLMRKNMFSLIQEIKRGDEGGFKQVFIDGELGIGKSGYAMGLASYFKSTADWIVIFIPRASRIIDGTTEFDPSPYATGSYIQNKYSANFLQDIISINEEKLKETLLTLKFEIDDSQWKGKTLFDLCEFGAKGNHPVACVDALFRELKQIANPVMMIIDGFNEILGGSFYHDVESREIKANQLHFVQQIFKFRNDESVKSSKEDEDTLITSKKTSSSPRRVFINVKACGDRTFIFGKLDPALLFMRLLRLDQIEEDASSKEDRNPFTTNESYLDFLTSLEKGEHEETLVAAEDFFRKAHNEEIGRVDEVIDKITILREIIASLKENPEKNLPLHRPVLMRTLDYMLKDIYYTGEGSTSDLQKGTPTLDLSADLSRCTYVQIPRLTLKECEKILEYYTQKGFIYPYKGNVSGTYSQLKKFMSGGNPRQLWFACSVEGIVY